MKKLILIIYLLTTSIYSQQSLDPGLITFPVSPEAARMVTYGNTPVNLFYGQLDKSVELFTGKIGDYQIPIALNYSYAGFRLEEKPSIVGLGWQLSAGGVVTREVRGYPDEHPKGYYAGGQYIIANYFATGTMTYLQAESLISGQNDSEADLYQVSVNGINFSFKIGLDGTPVFLSKHDYKLTLYRNPTMYHDIESFSLIDTNGNKYYFSIREYTQRIEGHDAVFQDNFQKYVTSWQLTTVTTNTGPTIYYNYLEDNFYNYSYYASGDNGILIDQNAPAPQASYSEGSAKDLIKRQLLSSIVCDNFSINFTPTINNLQKVYSKITVRDNNQKIVNTYDLNYGEPRNTLTKIERNGKFFYGFEYLGGIYVPDFINSTTAFPWNQDFWGFYNGKSNTYAFSRPTTYNSPPLTADRNPDFHYTKIGALTKITYPTGGYTTIDYEQNTIGVNYQSPSTQPNVKTEIKFKSDNTSTAPGQKSWTFTKVFTEQTIARLSHKIKTTNWSDIQIHIKRVDILPSNTTNYYVAIPSARGSQGSTIPMVDPYLYVNQNDEPCGECIFEENSGGTFKITPGTYEFSFYTGRNNYFLDVSVILEYYRRDIEKHTTMVNATTGGIRVKNITDYPVNGEPLITQFNYNDDQDISTAKLHSNLINSTSYRIGYVQPTGPMQAEFTITPNKVATEYSASPFNLLLKRGIPVYYSSVKKYTDKKTIQKGKVLACQGCSSNGTGGSYPSTYIGTGQGFTQEVDVYPNGYTQIIFDEPKKPQSFYPFAPVGNENSLGRIWENNIYSAPDTKNINKILLSERTRYHNYGNSNQTIVDENSNYPKSLKLGYKIRLTTHGQNYQHNLTINDCYYPVTYKESDMETLLWDKSTKEYFGENTMEKYESYDYNTHWQLSKVNTINDLSNPNNRLTTEIYYPYDFNDNISQQMVAKNVITPNIKVIKKRNNDVIETTQFNYGAFSGANYPGMITPIMFKPKSFSKSKGNSEPETLQNYSYDTKGNLTLMYKENIQQGISQNLKNNRTIIIWGYNESQIIAKIEGSEFTSIDSGVQQELKQKSNSDIDNCTQSDCTEEILRQALNNLRTLYPEAMITTYTYDSLIGVTSITDPRGFVSTYEYDDLGRLLRVKDHLGNILSENVYNYKLQN